MQPIAGYLYKQIITVIKNADFEPYRENQKVYAKPLQLYKGIDNRIQLVLRNNDQKPVRLLDSTVTFNLLDSTTRELVLSRQLQLVYTNTGTATTILESNVLNDLRAGFYHYSMIVVDPEGETQVVYADDNYQAQGKAHVSDSIYGTFVPSVKPNILEYINNSDTGYQTVAYTDQIPVADRVKSRAVYQTAQFNLTDFIGSIEAQASQDIASTVIPANWYTVASANGITGSGNNYITFQGKFNLIRFKITPAVNNIGTVNYILYRS